MLSGLKLYVQYAGISVRSQLQYRASFLMLVAGNFLLTCIDFLAIWALFDRFGNVRGWSLPEVALLYGMVNVSFAIAEGGARGFEEFATLVRSGEFDRILLRPRSPALQVLGREIQLFRLGRLTQGLAVLAWAAATLGVEWTAPRVMLAAAAVAGGSCLFTGLFVLEATLSFWTTSTLEIFHTVTYGGVETTQYPLDIYSPWFRRFFMFVIPLACVNYLPALAILDRPDTLGIPRPLLWAAPLMGFVFLRISLVFWQIGIRHYRSAGS